jgi:hypothetical protein
VSIEDEGHPERRWEGARAGILDFDPRQGGVYY